MYISLVIPTYNEEERIQNTLEQIIKFLDIKGYSYEIIVVDDGSKDNTADIIRNFSKANHIPIQILKSEINHGKGYAVRRGVLSSEGKYILFTDADLSTPIEEIEKLLPLLCDYDIVIGSRALRTSKLIIRQAWYRETMGKIFNLLVRIFIMNQIKDTQCGFKLFRAEVAKRIFLLSKLNRFAFDVEILFIAKKLGYKIKEVGIVWKNSSFSKVHIIKDSFGMLIELFSIILYNLKGIYG